MNPTETGISFIIPCYNEEKNIAAVLENLRISGMNYEIIVVNDGSSDRSTEILAQLQRKELRVIGHTANLGYGAAVKTGVRHSQFPWIAMVDADGTYPVDTFQRWLSHLDNQDMVVGARTGKVRRIPLLRRPAKWLINRLASFIVRQKIPDVNSGLRLVRRNMVEKYWKLLPNNFSLTTTLTIAMMQDRARVLFLPINYYRRRGRSKIRPLNDTYQFLLLILRLAMFFEPLRIFMPIFFFNLLLTACSLVRDVIHRNLADTTVILFLFSMIILMMGLLADLINRKGS